MLTVLYSPHATSVDNEAGRASGHADVPLSALGIQQASDLGKHYAAEAIDAVFCSDLQRAHRTAEIAFTTRQLPIIPDVRLREFDYGDLTQMPRDQLRLEQYIRQPFPNGESVVMAVERMADFLREILPDYDGKTVIVIGHSATRYGLAYLSSNTSLDEIIGQPWVWLEVPIWRYSFERGFDRLNTPVI